MTEVTVNQIRKTQTFVANLPKGVEEYAIEDGKDQQGKVKYKYVLSSLPENRHQIAELRAQGRREGLIAVAAQQAHDIFPAHVPSPQKAVQATDA